MERCKSRAEQLRDGLTFEDKRALWRLRNCPMQAELWRSAAWGGQPVHGRDLYEADFVCLFPTAKAAGYASTAPTGLVLLLVNRLPCIP